MMHTFNPISEIIQDLKKGKMVIVVDDKDRENEGDIIMSAQAVKPQDINFIIREARGLICVPMTKERLAFLGLYPMLHKDFDRELISDRFNTAWMMSVDAHKGITTGISAYDRAKTIKLLANRNTRRQDLVRPGHVFPLAAEEGGVLVRAGHTEACVDLLKLSRLEPVGVICEIMNPDGTMARTNDLIKFAKKFKLKICTIASLIEYRRKKESLIKKVTATRLPTEYGNFKLLVYESVIDKSHHLALVKGRIKSKDNILVRVHSQCLTGDVFHSLRCDCGAQLKKALNMISKHREGILLYMHQEGRGIGLVNKLHAYALQDKGLDTVEANKALGFEADLRDYGIGAQILFDLGVRKIRLLTNNPKKIIGLEGYGLRVIERIPLEVQPSRINLSYLRTKKKKLGHVLSI
ncbi:MAG: bifunctional 3,4-dihydroxy-2-butanone-4-phosphate synthase/GTP cyclohydrolase II [Candidatus Omnitrophota bacterium]